MLFFLTSKEFDHFSNCLPITFKNVEFVIPALLLSSALPPRALILKFFFLPFCLRRYGRPIYVKIVTLLHVQGFLRDSMRSQIGE